MLLLILSEMPFQSKYLAIIKGCGALVITLLPCTKLYSLFSLADGQVNMVCKLAQLYDSNIGSAQLNPVDDIISSATPKVTYFQDNGLLSIDTSLGIEVGRFYEDRRLNYENLQFQFGLDYPNVDHPNLKANFSTSYSETGNPNPIIGERTDSNTFSLLGGVRYNFLPIYGIGMDASSSSMKSLISKSGTRLSDVDREMIRGIFFYKYSELLELKLSYRFRENLIIGNNADSISLRDAEKMSGEDESISIGAEGSITSLLSGSIEFGAFRRKLNDGISHKDGFVSTTNLAWSLRPDVTTFSISLNADTIPTPVNDSIISKTLSLDLNHSYTQFLSSSISASYGITDFTNTLVDNSPRKDYVYSVGFGVNYLFSEYLTAELLGNHTWNDTNSGRGFKRNTMEVSIDLKM